MTQPEGFEVYNLRNGEKLRVEQLVPGAKEPDGKIKAIRDLILQPRKPWISEVERAYVEGALEGCFKGVARDSIFVGWVSDEPVGNVHYSTAASTPEIGALGFVITAPAHCGKGISSILTQMATRNFVAAGGVCMHLGTGNPVAHRIYQRCGFKDYSGHVMRYLAPDETWEDFDDTYFSDLGPAEVRPGHWGDQARVAMLYLAPHPWFVRDYPERLFCHPAVVQTRCGSILPSMMVNATQRNGGLWILENPAHRVVGAATLTRLDETAQSHAPILDFLIAPAYFHQAHDLLTPALSEHRGAEIKQLRVFLASCDNEKAEILQRLGFYREATLAAQFRAGDDHHDLQIYSKSRSGIS